MREAEEILSPYERTDGDMKLGTYLIDWRRVEMTGIKEYKTVRPLDRAR